MLTFEDVPHVAPANVASVSTTVPYDTKERLEKAARAAGMSLPSFLRAQLRDGFAPRAPIPPRPTVAAGRVVFAQESFAAVRDEIVPLWRAHYDEIAHDKDLVPLDPDFDRYAAIDAAGCLLIVTARKGGALIGYVFAVVSTHLHYRTTLFAWLDLYYLAPAHRGGRTALRLFETFEARLRDRGVVKAVGNCKLAHDHGRLFRHMGWHEVERIFTKTLGAA